MEDPTNEGIERKRENEALEYIVRPQLPNEEAMKIFLEENDYNQVLKRITSVPGWREDTELVRMFVVMRQRKRWFLSVPFIEEDLEIVSVHVYCPEYRLPDLSNLSEEERQLTIMVLSFIDCKTRSQNWKKAYEQIYSQIYAVKDWEKSVQLVYLHSLMKEEEQRNSFNVEYYGLMAKQWYAEDQKQQRSYQITKILAAIEKQRKNTPVPNEWMLLEHIHYIRGFKFWSKVQQLRNRHKKLLKENGTWKDRIQGISGARKVNEGTPKGEQDSQNSEEELTDRKNCASSVSGTKENGTRRSFWAFLWRTGESQQQRHKES